MSTGLQEPLHAWPQDQEQVFDLIQEKYRAIAQSKGCTFQAHFDCSMSGMLMDWGGGGSARKMGELGGSMMRFSPGR